ncbi:DUF397 domain-containing protein [Streptomyces sp. MMG1121]|uniref:DUF397 domain-containing protein n=1 Tax=Streptomyces sp. MMG1121 TaxID=1415544 RepID=UPI0006AF29A1|nr:DUF397 domain-containing protein [Streptomyces sp. MMG1121]KOV63634.1 toxin [Streptomyces sp. MMG1121]
MTREPSAGTPSEMVWFTSSYNGGTNGESCLEMATTPATVHVRDSKHTDGPRLTLSPTTWAAFLPYAAK